MGPPEVPTKWEELGRCVRAVWRNWTTPVTRDPPPYSYDWWLLPPNERRKIAATPALPGRMGCLGLIVIAVGLWSAGYIADSSPTSFDGFDDKFADGAAANTLEKILHALPMFRPGEIILAGLLLLIYGRLGMLIEQRETESALKAREQELFISDKDQPT